MAVKAEGWFLEAGKAPLVRRPLALEAVGDGEAIVEVLACGLCHTDLSYASGAVPTKHALPLVLGHEIVGTVVERGARAQVQVGAKVIVPAVIPCGACALCKAGRGNACPEQKMPGNDIHGGFATHVMVPANALVPVPAGLSDASTRALSVVADAVSTAYQALRRANVGDGTLVVAVGAGGVGGFLVQLARAMGARTVACDVKADKLAVLRDFGAEHTLDVSAKDAGAVRKELRGLAKEWRIGSERLAIFECSGTAPGQLLAFSLLERASTLVVVGYTPAKVEVRLSNLMAFDAQVFGTWGCPPDAYAPVLEFIRAGKVRIEPFVEPAPMSQVNELLRAMEEHRLERRMVLDPRK